MADLADGLKRALDNATDTVVLYTDLSRMSVWAGSREATLRAHADAWIAATEYRTLVVPTFNYDWCRTAMYDPLNDPAQVGALNEHLRVHHCEYRTRTPVFNFALYPDTWTPDLHPDPFGPVSMFRWLIDRQATVVAYGARPSNASACHVNERDEGVPYRYFKDFPGHIIGVGPFTLRYFVRDLTTVYDWDKLDAALAGCFTDYDVAGPVRVSRADTIYDRISEMLSHDKQCASTRNKIILKCEKI